MLSHARQRIRVLVSKQCVLHSDIEKMILFLETSVPVGVTVSLNECTYTELMTFFSFSISVFDAIIKTFTLI